MVSTVASKRDGNSGFLSQSKDSQVRLTGKGPNMWMWWSYRMDDGSISFWGHTLRCNRIISWIIGCSVFIKYRHTLSRKPCFIFLLLQPLILLLLLLIPSSNTVISTYSYYLWYLLWLIQLQQRSRQYDNENNDNAINSRSCGSSSSMRPISWDASGRGWNVG